MKPIVQALALAASAAHPTRNAHLGSAGLASPPLARGTYAGCEEGLLLVQTAAGPLRCECLEGALPPGCRFAPGDTLLVASFGEGETPVVLGRIGQVDGTGALPASSHLAFTATETLSLKCGESSVDLRADGKVMIRGDDVLVRAKGTQRIRAGTVSIN